MLHLEGKWFSKTIFYLHTHFRQNQVRSQVIRFGREKTFLGGTILFLSYVWNKFFWAQQNLGERGRWIRHWRTTWSTVCSSAPHSQAAEKAMPHLYKQERKFPTPVRRRFKPDPGSSWEGHSGGGWVPVSGWKGGVLWDCPTTPHSIGNLHSSVIGFYLQLCCFRSSFHSWLVVQEFLVSTNWLGYRLFFDLRGKIFVLLLFVFYFYGVTDNAKIFRYRFIYLRSFYI